MFYRVHQSVLFFIWFVVSSKGAEHRNDTIVNSVENNFHKGTQGLIHQHHLNAPTNIRLLSVQSHKLAYSNPVHLMMSPITFKIQNIVNEYSYLLKFLLFNSFSKVWSGVLTYMNGITPLFLRFVGPTFSYHAITSHRP